MAKLALSSFFFFFFFFLMMSSHFMVGKAQPAASPTITPNPNPTDFVKSSCKDTRYPALCVKCLSIYAQQIQQSHQQLAQKAISVALESAQLAVKFLTQFTKLAPGLKPMEAQATRDCLANMVNTVYQLDRSVRELGRTGKAEGQDFAWRMSNVRTWVSAGLTSQNTCLDGFADPGADGTVKVAVRNRVVNVEQVTSVALALVSRFAATQRAP